ncbi:hypothetical protein AB0454_35640 [Streptomyces sp. NPDC093509]|uniref:hypothetical protein n=1 Tax=Streptomyces sp. NPDC093509 TaxID=3154982 RepID=UPI00344F5C73
MNTCTNCGRGLTGIRALWTTCQACQERLAALLVAIEDDWPRLSDCLEPTGGHSGPRVSGTKEATIPIQNDRVLNLISQQNGQDVPSRLYRQYANLALTRRIRPATKPQGADHRVRLALYGIRKHLPWAVQGANLAGMLQELDAIASDLRQVVGAEPPMPSIPCPAQLPDGSDCAGRMRYDQDRQTVSCRTCRTNLNPAVWIDHWMKAKQENPACCPDDCPCDGVTCDGCVHPACGPCDTQDTPAPAAEVLTA